MPYIKALFHLVWSTKNRYPFLTKEIRKQVFEHIMQNAKTKGVYLYCVNGYTDHVHCLLSLSSDQTISKVVQLIKGESSFWINKQNLCSEKFEWQDEYFAVSISQSHIQKVTDYIRNQENHHQKKTFQQEYDEFIRSYDFLQEKTH
jgi:REP element-mobilizing transposase RayT